MYRAFIRNTITAFMAMIVTIATTIGCQSGPVVTNVSPSTIPLEMLFGDQENLYEVEQGTDFTMHAWIPTSEYPEGLVVIFVIGNRTPEIIESSQKPTKGLIKVAVKAFDKVAEYKYKLEVRDARPDKPKRTSSGTVKVTEVKKTESATPLPSPAAQTPAPTPTATQSASPTPAPSQSAAPQPTPTATSSAQPSPSPSPSGSGSTISISSTEEKQNAV